MSDFIEENTSASVLVWFSDCYGACDIPLGINTIGIDLIVQFGHNKFNKELW